MQLMGWSEDEISYELSKVMIIQFIGLNRKSGECIAPFIIIFNILAFLEKMGSILPKRMLFGSIKGRLK